MSRPASRSLMKVSMLNVIYASGDDSEVDDFRNRCGKCLSSG